MPQNEKVSNLKVKPLVVFSPLDWGFGHTLRLIPLIRAFKEEGCTIIIACNSAQRKIIANELTGVDYVELDSILISYGKNKTATRWKLLALAPKILIQVNFEHRCLQRLIEEKHPSAVISDNRYGFYSPDLPSVFITHQLSPSSGLGAWIDNLIRRYLYRYVNRFTECWVPDKKRDGLAGNLSNPIDLPDIPVKWIGPVTRLKPVNPGVSQNIKCLIILSGPEPQRTLLEKILLPQSAKIPGTVVIVRGVTGAGNGEHAHNTTIIDYAKSEQLQSLLDGSEYVVCRSGYTSIMDLIALRKKMILIPTPGQGEQEYLAAHLAKYSYALCFQQHRFSLSEALATAEKFDYRFEEITESYRDVVAAFVQKLISSRPSRPS